MVGKRVIVFKREECYVVFFLQMTNQPIHVYRESGCVGFKVGRVYEDLHNRVILIPLRSHFHCNISFISVILDPYVAGAC